MNNTAATLTTHTVDEEAGSDSSGNSSPSPTAANAVAVAAAPSSRVQLLSFRPLLLWIALCVLALSIPYFLLAPDHSNSCWIARSPRSLHREAARSEAALINVTGLEPPAVEEMISSPEPGRGRHPRWFYSNQTGIMIGLLLACLAIKMTYAALFLRPQPTLATAHTSGSASSSHHRFLSSEDASHEGLAIVEANQHLGSGGSSAGTSRRSSPLSSTHRLGARSAAAKRDSGMDVSPMMQARTISIGLSPATLTRNLAAAGAASSSSLSSGTLTLTPASLTPPHPFQSGSGTGAGGSASSSGSSTPPTSSASHLHSHHGHGHGHAGSGVASGSFPFAFHWFEVYRVLYSYLWYLASYFLCNALKSILADFSCSDHGNSVSGHFLFFCFCAWTLGWIHAEQKGLSHASMASKRFWRDMLGGGRGKHRVARGMRASSRVFDAAFAVCYAAYLCVVLSILSDTYFYGYHSMRQILYGFFLAAASFLVMSGTVEAVATRVKHKFGEQLLQVEEESSRQHLLPTQPTHQRGTTMRGSSKGSLHDLHSQHSASASTVTATVAPAPPAVLSASASYFPLLSAALHEWMHADEMRRAHRFYSMPWLLLLGYQIVAWLVLASAPNPGFFAWVDVGVVAVGHVVLATLMHTKLKLPKTNLSRA